MAKPRKPKKVKADDHPKEAIVLIPLTYNDGTQIPPETIDAICDEIFDTFHGWTIEGRVKGAYQMRSTGRKQVEEPRRVGWREVGHGGMARAAGVPRSS
jgi:hypothetical protein